MATTSGPAGIAMGSVGSLLERLHEVAQKAERSERNLQLQLFMAQQEQRRLRKELRAQQGLAPEPRTSGSSMEADPNARPEEEARWEVCQKTAEISLLKQQLREAQAELLQERLRGQEQALRFEQERQTWQEEKERVLRYQREIQGSYMDMYRRNQALEHELRLLREPPTSWSPRLESSKI